MHILVYFYETDNIRIIYKTYLIIIKNKTSIMSKKLSEVMKKRIAGNQNYKCANKPGANLKGLERYSCPLWKIKNKNIRGSFDPAGYDIDHIVKYSITKDNSDEIRKYNKFSKTNPTKGVFFSAKKMWRFTNKDNDVSNKNFNIITEYAKKELLPKTNNLLTETNPESDKYCQKKSFMCKNQYFVSYLHNGKPLFDILHIIAHKRNIQYILLSLFLYISYHKNLFISYHKNLHVKIYITRCTF